jgi:hypothetical protein
VETGPTSPLAMVRIWALLIFTCNDTPSVAVGTGETVSPVPTLENTALYSTCIDAYVAYNVITRLL